MIDRQGRGLTGGSAAAPIWAYFMKKGLQGKSHVNFPVPEGIRFAEIDEETGFIANLSTRKKIRVAIKNEVVLTLPPSTDSVQGFFPSIDPIIPNPQNIEEDVLPEL